MTELLVEDRKIKLETGQMVVVDSSALQQLLDALWIRGYKVIGPTVREAAIVYDTIQSVADLPIGWAAEQEAGTYRLKRRDDDAYFGYTVGPYSWKHFLHPPKIRLWQANKAENGYGVALEAEEEGCCPMAFIGVRACELSAIAIQDKVFLGRDYVDPVYKARREKAFMVAVNCGQAAATCFCASMGTGPKAEKGYDLALTEVLESERHFFLVEVGSTQGAEVIDEVAYREAGPNDLAAAEAVIAAAAGQIKRTVNTDGIKELLYSNIDHPRWENVAARCLNCTNCTMVCPTCFCTTVEDVTDLTGQQAERWRKWDSCFTLDFSYLHGGSVRSSAKARYRQWLTHKFASWIDQFGTSGCVGCGRCITWCPVGIDVTEELSAIRADSGATTILERGK